MKSKKLFAIITAVAVAVGTFTGCAQSGEGSPITVISREEGSGTRSAFIEMFGIEQENESGEAVDLTTELAETTNSTSVMMTTVAGNSSAIGYISLGSLDDSVKAISVDGAEASVENIKNGSYKVSRPFNIATKGELSEAAEDFISFIKSSEGLSVIENAGYISEYDEGSFTGGSASGKISVAGSSSVTPVMEKLKEAYNEINPNVSIEIQQSDSSTGMNSVIEGLCDIGMASRELKESEIAEGISPTTIAIDGIAVIVNNDSNIDGLTSEQIRDIFTGEITDWSELS